MGELLAQCSVLGCDSTQKVEVIPECSCARPPVVDEIPSGGQA